MYQVVFHLYGEVSTNDGSPIGWFINVYNMDNSIQVDDLGVPPISGNLGMPVPDQARRENLGDVTVFFFFRGGGRSR